VIVGVVAAEAIRAAGRLLKRRSPQAVSVRVERSDQSEIGQKRQPKMAADALDVLEEEKMPAVVAVENLHTAAGCNART